MERPTESKLKALRLKITPMFTRIRLIHMPDDPFPVPEGTEGTAMGVDDAGNIIVHWDNGSTLNLIYNVDTYEIL